MLHLTDEHSACAVRLSKFEGHWWIAIERYHARSAGLDGVAANLGVIPPLDPREAYMIKGRHHTKINQPTIGDVYGGWHDAELDAFRERSRHLESVHDIAYACVLYENRNAVFSTEPSASLSNTRPGLILDGSLGISQIGDGQWGKMLDEIERVNRPHETAAEKLSDEYRIALGQHCGPPTGIENEHVRPIIQTVKRVLEKVKKNGEWW